MKTYNKLIVFALTLLMFNACKQDYIDPITKVAPGADQSAPVITVSSPTEGYEIKLPEEISSITINFEVTDDIEVGDISVKFDGTEIASFKSGSYKDYRRVLETVNYDNVSLGNHVISITGSDLDGKTTTKLVNIAKVSPYTPKYQGEVFYMPFEGDFMEMISYQTAGVVGSPGFADDGLVGSKCYAGATDSYLTFPIDNLKNTEFTIGLWTKINSTPDRSGILTVGSTDDDAGRKNGFRLFREGGASSQQIKLNVGIGSGEVWNDGGFVDQKIGQWVYIAITVTSTENIVYIDGVPVRTAAMTGPIDWTGCTEMTIGSGEPTFTYWNHFSDLSHYDNIRVFDHALTAEEIQGVINDDSPYVPKYDGEIFYMPFEGTATDKISMTSATTVGSPSYVDGKIGKAYQGATDAYLTFPTTGLQGNEFSASCWMKLPSTIDSPAGILVMSPEDTANPDAQNVRTSGFRFFYDNSSGKAFFKVNAGTGAGETWVDGGDAAKVDPAVMSGWFHVAFTISTTKVTFYINGEVIKQSDFAGISWTGCDLFSIMSGAPRFTGWGHKSCVGEMDELRLFDKALSQDEIKAIIADEN